MSKGLNIMVIMDLMLHPLVGFAWCRLCRETFPSIVFMVPRTSHPDTRKLCIICYTLASCTMKKGKLAKKPSNKLETCGIQYRTSPRVMGEFVALAVVCEHSALPILRLSGVAASVLDMQVVYKDLAALRCASLASIVLARRSTRRQ